MKIISIDPGYNRIGFAVLSNEENDTNLIYSECFVVEKDEFQNRLFKVSNRLEDLIKEYKPEVVAMEKIFFQKNKTTAMGISEIRGALSFISKKNNIEVEEYSPSQIKLTVTGNGSADKKQVIQAVSSMFNMDKKNKLDDEFDAIAVGITSLAYNSNKRVWAEEQ